MYLALASDLKYSTASQWKCHVLGVATVQAVFAHKRLAHTNLAANAHETQRGASADRLSSCARVPPPLPKACRRRE
jgi:hypothetical protein